jgi:N-acetylmuramoyl-L-alanine amidase
MSDAPLPSRPEVVAQADQLAVAGVRQGGSAGARLTLSAARLRTRLWRLERREADALEAIELYGAASRARWDGSCASTVERALLEGELRADPSGAYRELYRAKSAGAPKACGHIIDAALGVLSGFQPLPSVLAEIDRQVAAEHGDSGAARPASRDPSVRRDNGGQIVVPTLVAQLSKPARITSIERYAAEESARIVVFVTHPTTFDVGFIPAADGQRGPRFYVDIHRAEYHGRPAFDVGGIVERVRIGKQKEASRVVLDLADTVYRKVFYLPEPFRLVIDVSKHAPQRATPGARGPRSIKRVVIDPGHGGHDPGAVGPSGLREKDVTLDIAHRAAPLVARELGIVTLLTRDSDVYVPLDERTARANAFGADLFVSIHCNASEDGNGRGVMTFVLDESRDAVAVRIAARENAASPAAAAELANAMSRVVDASMTASSVHFAELLQKAAQASLSPSYSDVGDQGVKRAGFYVLAGARMPAVLFESSFISNPLGELRLNTGDYRQKMADAIVNAVRAYRDGH